MAPTSNEGANRMEILVAGVKVPKAARNKHVELFLCPACEEGFDLYSHYREHFVIEHFFHREPDHSTGDHGDKVSDRRRTHPRNETWKQEQ
jgi:hypothetical protein